MGRVGPVCLIVSAHGARGHVVRIKGIQCALLRLALFTKKARREGDVSCGLSQLLFDSLQKLETFLSTGGNKILSDRLVKVTGVISEEDGEPTDVYGALVGVGRFVNHYLGVRKGGPNVAIRASPGMGANDNFLTLEVCTRNHNGDCSPHGHRGKLRCPMAGRVG